MEPNNGGFLEDDVPFQLGDFYTFHVNFPGCMSFSDSFWGSQV